MSAYTKAEKRALALLREHGTLHRVGGYSTYFDGSKMRSGVRSGTVESLILRGMVAVEHCGVERIVRLRRFVDDSESIASEDFVRCAEDFVGGSGQ